MKVELGQEIQNISLIGTIHGYYGIHNNSTQYTVMTVLLEALSRGHRPH